MQRLHITLILEMLGMCAFPPGSAWGGTAEAVLTGADLKRADLVDADRQSADLCGTKLDGAYVSHANVKKVVLEDASIQRNRLVGARLSAATGATVASARRPRSASASNSILDRVQQCRGRGDDVGKWQERRLARAR